MQDIGAYAAATLKEVFPGFMFQLLLVQNDSCVGGKTG